MADRIAGPPFDPYAPPKVDADASRDRTSDPDARLLEEEVEAFVVKDGRFYWKKWSIADKAGQFYAGFNVTAFFFCHLWFLYRRMYKEFWVAGGLTIVASTAVALLGKYAASPEVRRSLDPAFNVVLGAVIGSLANGLYLRRARVAILAVRSSEPDPYRRLELLAQRGGTSLVVPICGAIGLIGAFTLGTMLLKRAGN